MNRFLFLLRTGPDVDHIAPMIWTCLQRGDQVLVVFEEPLPGEGRFIPEKDDRIRFLRQNRGFHVLPLEGFGFSSPVLRKIGRLIWNFYALRVMLRRQRIDACFFDWGFGETSDLVPLSPLRWLRVRFTKNLRSQLIMAGRSLGLPLVCLPHGVSTKLNIDISPHAREALEEHGGELPFEDRNCFTAYVFTSELQRRLFIEKARLRPEKAQAWGSLRFCPEWMKILERILPSATLPPKGKGRVRVLFFLPKWYNRVDKDKTVSLLKALAGREDVQLVLGIHPRKDVDGLDESTLDEFRARPNVCLAGNANSVSLVRASDAVVDVGSGMAVEAILQGKHLIYPQYLHENRLVFDELGGCAIARNEEEVGRFLDMIVRGESPGDFEAGARAVVREIVYAGREPYDVPAHYYGRVRELLKDVPAAA